MSEKKIRDVLFAPWRLAYLKKNTEPKGLCVFCEATKNHRDSNSLVVYKGKSCSVILNKYPYNNGHTMIIPDAHVQRITDLPQDTFEELHDLLRWSQEVLTEEYKPGGFNIGMNVGKTGGAGIADHLHYHIVPRWDGDSNFMPILGGTKVVSEAVEKTFERLKPYFSKGPKKLTASSPEIQLDHVGVAVENHSQAFRFWSQLGWVNKTDAEVVADQKVSVAMLNLKNNARIELLEATTKDSPVAKFIDKRGPGIHHICLRVKNIENHLIALKNAGVKLINELPVAGAHNCKVAFIHPSSTGGILLELSEKDEGHGDPEMGCP